MHRQKPRLAQSWLSSDRPVPRLVARPLWIFLSTEAAGGVVLLGATVSALLWVNLSAGSYESFWGTEIAVSAGRANIVMDIRHWVNDGLMTLFFFVVGLEIKRELIVGELDDVRKASLPALAALGGMVVPAVLFLAFNLGHTGARGWGIPMATDIAFAVGVLALLGDRIPSGLKVFLLSLAIVDDIGAILVIAFFYSTGVDPIWLAIGFGLLAVLVLLRRVQVLWLPVYAVIGVGVWFATFQSGVHATIAGVVLGFFTPALPSDPGGFSHVLDRARSLPDEPDAESVREISTQANEVVSVGERLEHLLHPWTSFVVVPLFALANAGVVLSPSALGNALTSHVVWGIVVGLVIGKVVGIFGMSWIALKFGWGALPSGVTRKQLFGVSAVAGIGFTVSLFIAGLAFSEPFLQRAAKVGVLGASLLAGVIGAVVLRMSLTDKQESQPREVSPREG